MFSTHEAGTTKLVWLFHPVPDAAGLGSSINGGRDLHVGEESLDEPDVDEQFLMTVVHELRTPINAISSYLSLLRSESIDEALKARAFEVIERNTALPAQLVSDLADRTRLIAGRLPLRLCALDLRAVATQAVDSVRRMAESAHLELQVWTVRQLVQVHSGSISAASDGDSRGTVLTVELPLLTAWRLP